MKMAHKLMLVIRPSATGNMVPFSFEKHLQCITEHELLTVRNIDILPVRGAFTLS